MAALDLDGILLLKFEDMYWLTGFASDGFTIFGRMFLDVFLDVSLNHVAGAMSPGPCRRGHVAGAMSISATLHRKVS
jgi:hypothetical protein